MIVTQLEECESLWDRGGGIFDDWALRKSLADLSGVTPHFLVEGETVLPLGMSEGGLRFYGGKYYNERNGFLGQKGGEKRILEHLKPPLRLLSWSVDPLEWLPEALWDVPYNQTWVGGEFQDKKSLHLLRRFIAVTESGSDWPLIYEFMQHTALTFRGRGRDSTYENEDYIIAVAALVDYADAEGWVRLLTLMDDGEPAGLGLLIETDLEVIFLMNLYRSKPSHVSNAVILAAIQYAQSVNKPLDALRGSFGLKKRYGMKPKPSYAVVNDPTWEVRPQTDLTEAELMALYGREFGHGAPPRP
jgi:hypothetical protein